MHCLKISTLSLGFVLATSAFASFDMLLQSDSDSSLGDHIDRYDPESRVYLGSFPIFGAPLSMAASSARGVVYVKTGSGSVDIFDYSSGGYLSSVSFAGINLALNAAQDKLYSINSGVLQILDLNTFSISSITLSGMTGSPTLVFSPSGRFIVADDTAATFRCYSSSGSLLSTAAYVGFTTCKQIAYRPNSSNSTTYTFRSVCELSTTMPGFTENAFSGAVNASTSAFAGYSSLTGAVSAHEGLYFAGVKTAAPTVLTATRMSSGGVTMTAMNLTQTSSLVGKSAIVLAPEPSEFAVMGIGLIALLARRKVRSVKP